MRSLFLLLAALFAVPALHAQKVTLSPFPAAGTFDVTTVQEMTLVMAISSPDSAVQAQAGDANQTMEMKQTTNASLTVARQEDATHISVVTDRIRMAVEAPGVEGMTYDSAAPEDGGFPLAEEAVWIGRPIEFRFEGDSLHVLELDSLIQSVVRTTDPELQQAQRVAFSEMFKQMVGAHLGMLPKTPVGQGDVFDVDVSVPLAGLGTMQMRGTWTVSRVEGAQASFGGPLTVEGEVAAPGMPFLMTMTGQGTYDATVDTATGDQENTTDMQMEATMDLGSISGGQAEGVMTMKMTMVQTQTMKRR